MKSVYLLLFLLAPLACAEHLDLDYTVMGTGGYSHAIAHFSDSPFWWIDNSGGITPNQVYTDYGYAIDGAPYWGSYPGYQGSLLLSSPFTVRDGESISVTVSLLSVDQPLYDAGFVVLLRDGRYLATLAFVPTIAGATGNPAMLSGSPGVTFEPDSVHFRGNVVNLGGLQYGPTLHRLGSTVLTGGSTNWITCSYAPGAGRYQLLFGAFDTIAPGGKDTAFAIQSVKIHHRSQGD